ncbi:MAG: RdgB/HAM1 family non-canonical purine NTP pyrophosphatase [Caldiserica bacterium]|nr:RdgB/HAM1 family non-canonical purine NTP pyrophosphatase [Caldisericota bacterium]
MPEENGQTIEENSRLKSVSIFEQTGLPTLAEDSGLCIDDLDGKPGIHSARFAGSTKENIEKVLELMQGVKDRKAHFETIFSFTDKNGTVSFKGIQNGTIGFEPKGDNGFGYDPIFINETSKTNAQCSVEEKNQMSARGKALRLFLDYIKSNI